MKRIEFWRIRMRRVRSSRRTKYRILQVLCGLVLIGCILWLVIYFVGEAKARQQMEEIRDTYVQTDPDEKGDFREEENTSAPDIKPTPEPSTEQPTPEAPTPEPPEATPQPLPSLEGYDVPEKIIDFAGLQAEQNKDIYAWITIPGTQIDYPVLQHPEQMDYYLEYNIDGSKGYPGCIYTQLINSKDWTDKNTVLYGHNMKNGSMFANLHNYGDPVFFEEHPYVYLYTEESTYVYQIFAAYEYSNVHLLLGIDIDTPAKYQKYLDSIFENDGLGNQFDMDVELTSESRIITLSTCIGGKAEKRWLVQAVLVAEGEE